ncbi:hypothetical protein OUZ56_019997 [Daphnia magna]|uniref:PARP catalytic domain-containing protein n=1 Tax=Daphnia magna TaxID=35525 RepID=A0ABQ9ZEA0_9CRUS|nr:hypothetical protein OUZ56_019997 [Daphnia magna]
MVFHSHAKVRNNVAKQKAAEWLAKARNGIAVNFGQGFYISDRAKQSHEFFQAKFYMLWNHSRHLEVRALENIPFPISQYKLTIRREFVQVNVNKLKKDWKEP